MSEEDPSRRTRADRSRYIGATEVGIRRKEPCSSEADVDTSGGEEGES